MPGPEFKWETREERVEREMGLEVVKEIMTVL